LPVLFVPGDYGVDCHASGTDDWERIFGYALYGTIWSSWDFVGGRTVLKIQKRLPGGKAADLDKKLVL
jgi:hypothetical protein